MPGRRARAGRGNAFRDIDLHRHRVRAVECRAVRICARRREVGGHRRGRRQNRAGAVRRHRPQRRGAGPRSEPARAGFAGGDRERDARRPRPRHSTRFRRAAGRRPSSSPGIQDAITQFGGNVQTALDGLRQEVGQGWPNRRPAPPTVARSWCETRQRRSTAPEWRIDASLKIFGDAAARASAERRKGGARGQGGGRGRELEDRKDPVGAARGDHGAAQSELRRNRPAAQQRTRTARRARPHRVRRVLAKLARRAGTAARQGRCKARGNPHRQRAEARTDAPSGR